MLTFYLIHESILLSYFSPPFNVLGIKFIFLGNTDNINTRKMVVKLKIKKPKKLIKLLSLLILGYTIIFICSVFYKAHSNSDLRILIFLLIVFITYSVIQLMYKTIDKDWDIHSYLIIIYMTFPVIQICMAFYRA